MQPNKLQDSTTLLTYSLTTSPMPVQVSPSTTVASVASLTFVVSCPRSVREATVAQISIALPVDPKRGPPDPTNLAETAPLLSSASISSSGSDEWVVAAGVAPGTFVFTPKNAPVLVSAQSLTIEFTGIQVNTLVGTALVKITEWAAKGTGTPPPVTNPPSGVGTFAVAKFPYGFFAGNFTADQPMIENGQQPTLSWQGSTNATYKILYEANPPVDVSNIRTWSPTSTPPSPVLTHTTTFILQVSAQVDGQTASIDFNITIEVDKPSLVANDLTVLTTAAIGKDGTALTVNAAGHVGIGTAAPGSQLDVNGTAQLRGAQNGSGLTVNAAGSVGIGTNDPKSTLSVKGGAAVGATYAASVAKPNELIVEGNVGIGTNDPKHKLEVAGGSIQLDGSQQIIFTNEGVTNQLKLQFWGGFGLGINSNTQFYTAGIHSWRDTASNEAMSLNSGTRNLTVNGYVGIGVAPTKAGLEVANNVLYTSFNITGGLVDATGCYSYAENLSGARNVSIYTDSLFWTNSWIIASSDLRLKRVHGVSDGAADLNTLLGIEVTDYSYIDWISKGTDTHKKLIAQQVMKVFPQAVSKCTNAVPDIYETAATHDGWVQLATNLKKGERVRLIGEKNEGIHEVLEIAEGRFRTDFATESSEVFVFGREVDDFLNVDYDAIAMLNVSATQQLKKEKDEEVTALRAVCAELEAANVALQKRLQLLESKIGNALSTAAKAAAVTG